MQQIIIDAIRFAVREFANDGANPTAYPHMAQAYLLPTSVRIVDQLIPHLNLGNPRPFISAARMDTPARDYVWNHLVNCEPYNYEILVDICLLQGVADPYHVRLTAESEGFAAHAANLGTLQNPAPNNGMMWDLYKLLHVSSPFRLFITRSSTTHHQNLLAHTNRLVSLYSPLVARPTDTLWAIQFPTTSMLNEDVLIANWNGTGTMIGQPHRFRALP